MIKNVPYLIQLILSGLCFCSIATPSSAQNLIYNPGAELDPIWNGWTQVSGNWRPGNDAAVGAKELTHYFYAGIESYAVNGKSELTQDVNVSGNAANIDGGLATYTFSGWMRIYAIKFGIPNDRGQMIVEYRDASGNVLSAYDTGIKTSTSWVNYTDARKAPAGTRTIRIRLISIWVTGTESDGYMDDLSLTVVNDSTTPIELLSFDAVMVQDSVAVFWATAKESNNAYFSIEKSPDALNWSVIEEIPGANNSTSIIEYKIYDDSRIEGTAYYRLKQIDIDGAYTYSDVAVVHQAGMDVVLYPNPVQHELHVMIYNENNVTYSCANAQGQEIRLTSTSFNEEIIFDTSEWSSGIYFLTVQTEQERVVKKFVVE